MPVDKNVNVITAVIILIAVFFLVRSGFLAAVKFIGLNSRSTFFSSYLVAVAMVTALLAAFTRTILGDGATTDFLQNVLFPISIITFIIAFILLLFRR